MKPLFMTYLALLGFVAATVACSRLPLGDFQIPTAMLFAVAKALLVAWIFMELQLKVPLIRLAAVAGVFWVMILYFFGVLDFLYRSDLPIRAVKNLR